MAERGLSGSPAVNPRPKGFPIKDRAKFHKTYPVKTVRAIIDESINDQTSNQIIEV